MLIICTTPEMQDIVLMLGYRSSLTPKELGTLCSELLPTEKVSTTEEAAGKWCLSTGFTHPTQLCTNYMCYGHKYSCMLPLKQSAMGVVSKHGRFSQCRC